MYVPNFKAIGPKTRPQWPKNTPNRYLWRNNVTTSLRREIFFRKNRCAYTICMYVPNFKAIGPKTRSQWRKQIFATSRRHDVVASWKFLPPHATRPIYPYTLSKFQGDRLSGQSLNIYKKVVVVVVVGSSNALSKSARFWPVLGPWGRGVEMAGNFFWLKLARRVPAIHPNNKMAKKQYAYGW